MKKNHDELDACVEVAKNLISEGDHEKAAHSMERALVITAGRIDLV